MVVLRAPSARGDGAAGRLGGTGDAWDDGRDVEGVRPSGDGDPVLGGSEFPAPETRGRLFAIRTTALVAIVTTMAYLAWRVAFTVRGSLWLAVPLWLLELHALIGLGLFTFSLWDLDG